MATHEAQVKKLQTELKNSQEENDQIKQRFSTFFNTTFNGSSDLMGTIARDPSHSNAASGTANTRADKKKRKFCAWTDAEMMTLYRLRCAIGSNDWKALERTQKLTTRDRMQMSMKWIQHVSFKTKCSPLETSFKNANAKVAWKTKKGVLLGIVTDCNKDAKTKEVTWTITYSNKKTEYMGRDKFLAALDFFDEQYKK